MHFMTPKPESRTVQADDPDRFDLSRPEHYGLVRRMYTGRFAARIQAAGIDHEDGFQTALEGLLRKSQSDRSRWDPSRGSLSTWVYVALNGLTLNMVERANRSEAKTPMGEGKDAAEQAIGEEDDRIASVQFNREARHREPLEFDPPRSRMRNTAREVVRVGPGLVRVSAHAPYTPPAEYPPVERVARRSRAAAGADYSADAAAISRAVQVSLFDDR